MIRDDTAIELARARNRAEPTSTRQLLERIAKEQDTNGRSGKLGGQAPSPAQAPAAHRPVAAGHVPREKLVETLDVEQTLENIVLEPETQEEIEELPRGKRPPGRAGESRLKPRHTVLLIGPPGKREDVGGPGDGEALGRPLHRIGYGKADREPARRDDRARRPRYSSWRNRTRACC